MSRLTPTLPAPGGESIPFWRDARVLAVLVQIAFVVVVVLGARWFIGNVASNIDQLGAAQFVCRDGGSSFRCAFDFLELQSQFDIAEKPLPYTPADSYWRALGIGLLNTVKVAVLGVILATILGTFTGIARLSSNWLVSNVAKWYVDIIRNTPLLLQLFFLYFAVLLTLPPIRSALQPFGLPIFLSQRGVNLPWPVAMPSFAIWLAFIILGIIQVQVLWVILGRREEKTGKSSNRLAWALLSFFLVIGAGWLVSTANSDNQALLIPRAAQVREYDDLQGMMVRRLRVDRLSNIENAIQRGTLTPEAVDAAAFTVCVVRDSAAESNIIAELSRSNIPFRLTRVNRPDQAVQSYADGGCEAVAAPRVVLAAERDLLENSTNHLIIGVRETPLRLSFPRLEGLNFVGGAKMTPEFAAILIGLVIYTGAFIAEIVRAGIQSVAKGQSEAARALGLTESQRLQLVVMPQALRVIIPPLTSQYLNLTKNSSLAIAVAFPDLWSVSYTTINQSGRAIQIMLLVMLIYLSVSLMISALLNWYNSRIALVER